jgi:hypothetical protein
MVTISMYHDNGVVCELKFPDSKRANEWLAVFFSHDVKRDARTIVIARQGPPYYDSEEADEVRVG